MVQLAAGVIHPTMPRLSLTCTPRRDVDRIGVPHEVNHSDNRGRANAPPHLHHLDRLFLLVLLIDCFSLVCSSSSCFPVVLCPPLGVGFDFISLVGPLILQCRQVSPRQLSLEPRWDSTERHRAGGTKEKSVLTPMIRAQSLASVNSPERMRNLVLLRRKGTVGTTNGTGTMAEGDEVGGAPEDDSGSSLFS